MSYDTEERLSAALRSIAGDRPYTPDIEQIESHGRKLRHRRVAWRATAGTGFAAAIAAVAVATTGVGTHAPAPNIAGANSAATSTAGNAPLVRLVGYLSTAVQPGGNATLVLRDQVYTDGLKVDVWDLFADNGDDYFARTRDALPAQVKGKHTAGDVDKAGRQQVVAVALYAAKGDLNEARTRMAYAYEPKNPKAAPFPIESPGATPSLSAAAKEKLKLSPNQQIGNLTDSWVWNNSMEALAVGGGSPTVRAGVLRLLGQMPEVTVVKSTLKGQPVLVLSATSLATGNGTESLTVNADTGLPIKYVATGVTVNYTVSRVTLTDVANGNF